MTVDKRCAITMDVLPVVALRNASRICYEHIIHESITLEYALITFEAQHELTYSVIESRDDVASSKINIGLFFKIALAIATRCFSPPLNFNPRSPTGVSYPFGHLRIESCKFAILAALKTSSLDLHKFP